MSNNPSGIGLVYKPGTEHRTKVDFPFDLNNLFSMQYSFD